MTAYAKVQASAPTEWMKAVRVHRFGGLESIVFEEIPRPVPGAGQVLIRVRAAGVGPWDAWIRAGQSALHQPLPLVLGSDVAGIVTAVGPGVRDFQPGDEVFGATNADFTGAYAEYALAEAAMIARKPASLNFVEAASVPVVAVTAWQMVYDYGQLKRPLRTLVQGGAGNVGAYAVQLAKRAGAYVIATAQADDVDYVRALGADQVIDTQAGRFEDSVKDMDVVIDTVGGDTLDRSFAALKSGGVLVSAVAMPDQETAARCGVRAMFFMVAVTAERLTRLAGLFNAGQLTTHVGETLPLASARLAHEMLAGKPHKPGKIVLTVGE